MAPNGGIDNSINSIGHTYEDPFSLHDTSLWCYCNFLHFDTCCHRWLVKMKEKYPNLGHYLWFLKSQCETESKAQDAEKWKPLVRYNYVNKDWPITRNQPFTIFCSLTEVLTIFTNYHMLLLKLNDSKNVLLPFFSFTCKYFLALLVTCFVK